MKHQSAAEIDNIRVTPLLHSLAFSRSQLNNIFYNEITKKGRGVEFIFTIF